MENQMDPQGLQGYRAWGIGSLRLLMCSVSCWVES